MKATALFSTPPGKKHSTKRQTVQLTVWVKPAMKAELQRRAERENLSLSATSAALLETALQTQIDMQYGALLLPLVKQVLSRELQGMSNRLAWLLVRIAFDVGQIRGLATNILGRQQGVNEVILKTILQESSNAAKKNMTRRTPQLTELMAALEQWLHELDEGREAGWQS